MIIMNMRQLRVQAGLPRRDLANMADVSERTIMRVEEGTPIRDYLAQRILDALNKILIDKGKIQQNLTIDEIDDLKIA